MAVGLAAHRKVTAASDDAETGSAPVEFRVDVVQEPRGIRVRPVGEIDLATIGPLREHMYAAIGAGAGLVILDLRQTTFLDSTGLRLAVDADERAASEGIEFAIIAGPPAVQRTFEIAGLRARLPFVGVPRA